MWTLLSKPGVKSTFIHYTAPVHIKGCLMTRDGLRQTHYSSSDHLPVGGVEGSSSSHQVRGCNGQFAHPSRAHAHQPNCKPTRTWGEHTNSEAWTFLVPLPKSMLFLIPPPPAHFNIFIEVSSAQYENKDTVLIHSGFSYCVYIHVSIIDEMTEWSFCPQLVLAYYRNNGKSCRRKDILKKKKGGVQTFVFFWIVKAQRNKLNNGCSIHMLLL